jgi:hypothetical protein
MERLPAQQAPGTQATAGCAHVAENEGHDAALTRRDHLQLLVCELLEENQRLRTRMAQLERQVASAERGLASATRGAGALF